MRVLIIALGLCVADALRIQAKKKDTWAMEGNAGTISFGKISAPIYDISDEPFQNIDFARGRAHGQHGSKTDEAADIDGPAAGYDGGLSTKGKEKIIAEAMKECTPDNSQKEAEKNPVGKVPYGFPKTSAIPATSFYGQQIRQHTQATMGCSVNNCQVPTYLAAREEAKEPQKIPRIIWMTMADSLLAGKIGPFQYSLMAEHFKQNPEYEWVVSGDEMSLAFMHSKEVKPEWTEAYDKARNGAERADIWRYAVMYVYGGVYMDSDMTAVAPYKTFVDTKADIVQQCTEKGSANSGRFETSQFALFMSPGSKLISSLLDKIAEKFKVGLGLPLTIRLTGPGALSQEYVAYNTCGMKSCGSASAKVCGVTVDSCEDPELGKVVLLYKVRDFNTGKVWHKSDVCALAETRSKFTHWAQAGKAQGGKK